MGIPASEDLSRERQTQLNLWLQKAELRTKGWDGQGGRFELPPCREGQRCALHSTKGGQWPGFHPANLQVLIGRIFVVEATFTGRLKPALPLIYRNLETRGLMTKSHTSTQRWSGEGAPFLTRRWPYLTTQTKFFIFTGHGHCLYLYFTCWLRRELNWWLANFITFLVSALHDGLAIKCEWREMVLTPGPKEFVTWFLKKGETTDKWKAISEPKRWFGCPVLREFWGTKAGLEQGSWRTWRPSKMQSRWEGEGFAGEKRRRQPTVSPTACLLRGFWGVLGRWIAVLSASSFIHRGRESCAGAPHSTCPTSAPRSGVVLMTPLAGLLRLGGCTSFTRSI